MRVDERRVEENSLCNMLPASHRLPSSDIGQVMRSGKRVSNNFLELFFVQSHTQISRFAFVVPIRVDRRATARNRVKRLLREAVQTLLPNIRGGIDAVIFAKSKLLVAEEQKIAQSVDELLHRAGFFEKGVRK